MKSIYISALLSSVSNKCSDTARSLSHEAAAAAAAAAPFRQRPALSGIMEGCLTRLWVVASRPQGRPIRIANGRESSMHCVIFLVPTSTHCLRSNRKERHQTVPRKQMRIFVRNHRNRPRALAYVRSLQESQDL